MRTYLIKFFLRLCALMPLSAAHMLGACAGWALILLPNEARRVSRINIECCFPQMDPVARRRLANHSLVEMGKTAAETGPLWLWSQERMMRLVRSVSGEDGLAQALAAGNGAILAAPHLGNWELVGLYCSTRYRMTSLYRPPRLSGLDALITAARERFGASLVPSDTTGVRALFKSLQRSELVGILPDQEPRYGNGVFSTFFGTPAYTMTLLARLARHAGTPVFIAYAERLADSTGFHLHFEPLALNTREASVADITAATNAAIESCVRRIPHQYQWAYKRFKTRPAGEPGFYPR